MDTMILMRIRQLFIGIEPADLTQLETSILKLLTDNVQEKLIPIGRKVLCNGTIDVIENHVEPGTENYLKGYRYVLKEHGTQSVNTVADDYVLYSPKGKLVWMEFQSKTSTGSYAIANGQTEEIAAEIADSLNKTKRSAHYSNWTPRK